jgi:hypothetical protein
MTQSPRDRDVCPDPCQRRGGIVEVKSIRPATGGAISKENTLPGELHNKGMTKSHRNGT